MTEIWKDIQGYEKIYQVSSSGLIKSLSRSTSDGRTLKERILKQTVDKDGYCTVSLYDSTGKVRNLKQHRIVATTFLPNPKNRPHVNHKNGVKTDNNVSNLEWLTCAENNQHQLDSGLKTLLLVEVYQNNNLITILNGKQEQIQFGLDPSSVSKCLHGKRKTHKGFTFKIKGNTND